MTANGQHRDFMVIFQNRTRKISAISAFWIICLTPYVCPVWGTSAELENSWYRAFKRTFNKNAEQHSIHRGCMSQTNSLSSFFICFSSLWTIWQSRNCKKCVKKDISYSCMFLFCLVVVVFFFLKQTIWWRKRQKSIMWTPNQTHIPAPLWLNGLNRFSLVSWPTESLSHTAWQGV